MLHPAQLATTVPRHPAFALGAKKEGRKTNRVKAFKRHQKTGRLQAVHQTVVFLYKPLCLKSLAVHAVHSVSVESRIPRDRMRNPTLSEPAPKPGSRTIGRNMHLLNTRHIRDHRKPSRKGCAVEAPLNMNRCRPNADHMNSDVAVE